MVGTNISLIPVPGLEKTKVDPIPTPERVPSPTDSVGLKYNSLSILMSVPPLLVTGSKKVKVLGFWETRLLWVWAAPIVELKSLITLTLELSLSTFNTFTHSVPIPKRSFSLT